MRQGSLKGQLMLEVLIALSVAAIVTVIGGQIIFVSMQGNKYAGDRDVAMGLANETFEAVESLAVEDWSTNIYSLTNGSTPYYTQNVSGAWDVVSGQENTQVSAEGVTYTRSFSMRNVCRDNTSSDITGITDNSGATETDGSTTSCTLSTGTHDPSTQQVTVTVSWPNAESVVLREYITRWMNQACVQTEWSSGVPVPSGCPGSATTYESTSNITSGTSLELCSGGC